MAALDTEDYSIYSNMSDEQLLQVAIERSLTDTNRTPWQNRQILSHSQMRGQCSRVQGSPPANPPPNVPSNPPIGVPPKVPWNPSTGVPPNMPSNPPCEKPDSKISRDFHNHYFSNDKNKVVAWTRYNGHLRVTVESVKDLDPFLSAIWNGDAEALNEIIQSEQIDVSQVNQDGWIPLHEAAYYGFFDCLKILLHADPNTINRRTNKNQTPLLLAVSRKHIDCIEYLLEQGADPNLPNNQSETPLYKACEKVCELAVGLLLRFGASTSRTSVNGVSPLHEAVRNKNLQICKMLLQAGANPSIKSKYGVDEFFTAAQCGAVEVVSFLLMKGVDVNTQAEDGASALFEASKNGHTEVVKVLLSSRADVNKSNKAGLLPIHIAAKNGHDEIVYMLIPKTSWTKIKMCGISPLHLAAERNRDDVLETLIDAGCDVNAMMSEDWSKMYEDHRSTALYCSVANSNMEAAQMLLEAGADPNLDTFNPLLVAVRKGCMEMVKLLVQNGANVNAALPTHPTDFPAALMFSFNYLPMFKYLMDNGCNAPSCFKCNYGNGPHPPVKPSRNRRDGGYYMVDENSEEWYQFCEMISRPSSSCWAGPVIDILLDYVGHVKLCSRLNEHLDSYSDWALIKEKAGLPPSLMHFCRITIRQQLGVQRLKQISDLPLPGRMIKYLRHERESFKHIL